MWVVLMCGDEHFTNFWAKDRRISLPKIVEMSLRLYCNTLLGLRLLFSRRVAVLVASVHKEFLKKKENCSLSSIAATLLNTMVNFHSTWPFWWGVPGAVYSNSIPIPSFWNCIQNPYFLQHYCIIHTWPDYHT